MKNKVVLRKITPADTDNIVAWRNNPAVRKNLYTQTELTAEQHLAYLKKYVDTGKCAQYIISVQKENSYLDIGTTFIKNIDRNSNKGEFGIFIGEDTARGREYSYPAIFEILNIAFTELKLNRVYLSVFADNIPAIKSYIKCGFVLEGILKEDYLRSGKYMDIVVMGITKKMWLNNKESTD